jgi:hypothetical protein
MQLLFSGALAGPDAHLGIVGILAILDVESGRIVHICEYKTPEDRWVPEQKIQITGFCFVGDTLYACSHNEILVFDEWPPKKPAGRISIPGFNDLHHCMSYRGALAMANTGLETIDLLSFSGELEHRWDLLEGVPGARVIRDDVDYRMIPDTKPHLRHPNHLFELDGELWTGQLRTSDAICVSAPGGRLEMKVGMPHDGSVIGDEIVFTTTNDYLVFHDPEHPERFRAYDLTEMTPGQNQLGWCRGVAPNPELENRYFVAFSKVRRTRWKEFGFRVKHGHKLAQGRICEYDLEERRLLATHTLEKEDPGYVIFQLKPLPEALWV